MTPHPKPTGHAVGRLRRMSSELYLGALVVSLVLIVGIGLVAVVSRVASFMNWVALND